MNFLDYLTNAMTGGQPTQQELMARQMAQQGLLAQTGAAMTPEELKMLQMQQLRNVTGAAVSPRELQRTTNAINPVTMPYNPSKEMSPYMQNLTNPGMTMQQNYIDPSLIEQMYYRGLLSR
jgi:hypothetical protein